MRLADVSENEYPRGRGKSRLKKSKLTFTWVRFRGLLAVPLDVLDVDDISERVWRGREVGSRFWQWEGGVYAPAAGPIDR